MNNAFDPHEQANDINAKIVAGLERLSTVFRAVIQQQAKANKLTPLQTQLILFIASHRDNLCTVSRLAEEFVVTKATVSDSIRVLVEKGYLSKKAKADPRTFSLTVTSKGTDTLHQLQQLTQVFDPVLSCLSKQQRETTWQSIIQLISTFQAQGLISTRMCMTCQHFQKSNQSAFCNLLQSPLTNKDLRIDCPEHEAIK